MKTINEEYINKRRADVQPSLFDSYRLAKPTTEKQA